MVICWFDHYLKKTPKFSDGLRNRNQPSFEGGFSGSLPPQFWLFHPSFDPSTFSGCRVSILPASSSSRHWRPQRPAASASCGRLYGAYRQFQWRWGRSLLLFLQPPAWIPLWRRDTWTETEQTQGCMSFLSTSPPLPLSMNAWSDCHAQWSPSFLNQLLLTTTAANYTILIENHNRTKSQDKILYGTLPTEHHADTKTTIL